jgi:Kdo2-lipid IVA lauroyltransferase/acyltransferase
MARQKSPFVLRAEYYPLKALLGFLGFLPLAWSRPLCRMLVSTLLRVVHKRRALIERQIAECFPEASAAQKAAIASQSIDCLGDSVAAFSRITRLAAAHTMDAMVEVEGFEHIEEAYRQGKGMITFTAHYGCWEMMAVYVTQRYPRVSMLVRPLDNSLLDALVSGVRGSGGGGVVDSSRVFKDGLRLLRRNGILGILIDQNFYKGGVFVDFFGRPAATSPLVPILARRTGCVVLPMHNLWVGNKIRIICEAPVTLSKNPEPDRAILEDTQTLTHIVERWVRERPDQWLWLHNRWKRRPMEGEEVFTPTAIPHPGRPTTGDRPSPFKERVDPTRSEEGGVRDKKKTPPGGEVFFL